MQCQWIFALVLVFTLTQCQLDTSRCADCDSMYTDWVRNKTRSSYWSSHPDAVAAGEHICQWAEDIYANCYDTCARDDYGNTVSYTATYRAVGLKRFTDEHCLDGVCRLADTQTCSYLPTRRSKCDPETLDCVKAMLDDCGKDKLCTAGERRAYGQAMIDELSCYLSYPGNKIEGMGYTMAEEQGLQQCKDIIIVECLKSWSDKEYDLVHITGYSNETKDSFCSAEEETMNCLYSVSNSTVTYAGYTYAMPCKPELLNNAQVVDDIRKDAMYVYSSLCDAQSDPCLADGERRKISVKKEFDDHDEEEDDHDKHDHAGHDHGHVNDKKFKGEHITDIHKNKREDNSGTSTTSTSAPCISVIVIVLAVLTV